MMISHSRMAFSRWMKDFQIKLKEKPHDALLDLFSKDDMLASDETELISSVNSLVKFSESKSPVILLIGATGDGKSFIGNKLVGSDVFKTGNRLESTTFVPRANVSYIQDLLVIDTIGLCDTDLDVVESQIIFKQLLVVLMLFKEINGICFVISEKFTNDKKEAIKDVFKLIWDYKENKEVMESNFYVIRNKNTESDTSKDKKYITDFFMKENMPVHDVVFVDDEKDGKSKLSGKVLAMKLEINPTLIFKVTEGWRTLRESFLALISKLGASIAEFTISIYNKAGKLRARILDSLDDVANKIRLVINLTAGFFSVMTKSIENYYNDKSAIRNDDQPKID